MKKSFFLTLFLFFLLSCKNDLDREKYVDFMKTQITIPYTQFEKKVCSMFSDTLSDKTLRLVNYIKMEDCTPCRISALTAIERQSWQREHIKDVEFVYIVETSPQKKHFVYKQLCNARIEGSVYLDTCSAFLQANPHFPDNPLLHTFILNKKDSVVLFGDPFKNEKMENLLLKVIEREKQRLENEQNK